MSDVSTGQTEKYNDLVCFDNNNFIRKRAKKGNKKLLTGHCCTNACTNGNATRLLDGIYDACMVVVWTAFFSGNCRDGYVILSNHPLFCWDLLLV
jgi:hypothetical protein